MKNLLTIFFLMAFGPASAEWTKVSEGPDIDSFYDFSTIQRSGDTARVWGMISYKTKQSDGSLSSQNYQEYDCRDKKWRIIQIYKFAEPLGKGQFLESISGASQWRYIRPDSFVSTIYEIICVK